MFETRYKSGSFVRFGLVYKTCIISVSYTHLNSSLMKYKAIFERNADRLVNANTIYEGQVIVLSAK